MIRKITSGYAGLIDRCWYGPKDRVSGSLRKMCDDMPPKRRVTVVAVLMSVFVLTAFYLFGHACYRMGARQAANSFEIEHIHGLEVKD